MVTYYNKKDLISFGNYLLSEERRVLFVESYKQKIRDGVDSPLSVEESLAKVYHSDVDNWLST